MVFAVLSAKSLIATTNVFTKCSPLKTILVMKASTISFIAVSVLFAAQNLQAQSWSLTGNSGTNHPSNFIGTTDAHALVFKVNNSKSGYLDYDASKANTGF